MGASEPRRVLVVKLAGLGDLLTALPALYALRERFPQARLELLTTPAAAELARNLVVCDEIIPFDKYLYDRFWQSLYPWRMWPALRLAARLARPGYDCLVLLHHLTTRWGALKFAALALAAHCRERVGLDNGRGWFLTQRIPDGGFGAKHEVDYWLEVVAALGGAPRVGVRLELEFAPGVEELAQGKLAEVLDREALAGSHRRIIVHPGSGPYAPLRRWPADRFAAVADALTHDYGAHIFLVGGPGERELVARVSLAMQAPATDLSGRLSLVEVAFLMKTCQLFIGGDSGLTHLAWAMGLPLVAIFGPTNHLAWGPYGDRCRLVRLELPCSPCLYVGHRVGDPSQCPNRLSCLDGLSVESVLEAAQELLEGNGIQRGGQDIGPAGG